MAVSRGNRNGRNGRGEAGVIDQGEGVLNAAVRRTLKAKVLELRHLLEAKRGPDQPVEGDFRRQLAAVGIDEQGIHPLPAGRTLNEEQQRVRQVAEAVILHEQQNGSSPANAYAYFLRESAYTFLNRVIGLRCLEARGHMVVQGQTETAIWQKDELGGVPSLYWRLKNTLLPTTPPRELWREVYRRACEAVSRDIQVLFDPQSEFAALFPLLPTMQQIVASLNDSAFPPEAYSEDALLGWVYQYFQSEEKNQIFEEVRTKKKQIAGTDIVPVTQLYTEQYMVDFLLQNSLGRAWMEMYPDSQAKSAWPYFVTPATLPSRSPKPLKEWAILDPCVGSGHFLVVAFDLLVQLYAEERKLAEIGRIPWEWAVPEDEVACTILERNLYGIDIDPRAVQLTTLALYLKGKEVGLSQAPRIHAVAADASFLHGEEWKRFLESLEHEPSVRRVLEAMAGYLKDIRDLGSLLQPEKELKRIVQEEHRKWEDRKKPQQDALFPEYQAPKQGLLAFEQITDEEFWERLASRADSAIQAFLDTARNQGQIADQVVAGEAQRGFAFMELNQRRYDVVCTNPPYMGSSNMGSVLKNFIAKHYTPGKRDLYAAFIIRCHELAQHDGNVAMVTQQSWMQLSDFEPVRVQLLKTSCIEYVVHLGPRAFNEISGEVVDSVLLVFKVGVYPKDHSITIFDVADTPNSMIKDSRLRELRINPSSDVYVIQQHSFITLPGAPLIFNLPPILTKHLASEELLGKGTNPIATIRDGINTGDNERLVRYFWEVPLIEPPAIWRWYAKGGGYCKWLGLEYYVVAWGNGGEPIASAGLPGTRLQNTSYAFRPGLTYTLIGQGNLSVRLLNNAAYDGAGLSIFTYQEENRLPLLGLLNSRLATFIARSLVQGLRFRGGYIERLPVPRALLADKEFRKNVELAISLKQELLWCEITERCFRDVFAGNQGGDTLLTRSYSSVLRSMQTTSQLLTVEAEIEDKVVQSFGLNASELEPIYRQVGHPAGWLAKEQSTSTNAIEAKLRADWVPAGSVSKALQNVLSEDLSLDDETIETSDEVLGRPIPAETILEAKAQQLGIHPELLLNIATRLQLLPPGALSESIQNYASVTTLGHLGYRWPVQDAYEREYGPLLEPALVASDGIIPLVRCGNETTAYERLHSWLEHDFGEESAAQSEYEFRQQVGRPLDEWLRREFFKRHIQQFKQRPIAWHFVSPKRTFEAFVLYHQLCDEATGRATLQRLRTQYAGGLIERLRAEQDRARANKDEKVITQMQLAIEDVEDFRAKLEAIERGDTLTHRIRCRWKGDEAKVGRPGPYTPDVNDGVKVNIRPFQEAGLLAAPVIKKWD